MSLLKSCKGYLKTPIKASELSKHFNLVIPDSEKDLLITNVSALKDADENSLYFYNDFKPKSGIAIGNVSGYGFYSNNPRNDFVRAVNWIDLNIGFVREEKIGFISNTCIVEVGAIIEKNVSIGDNTIIKKGAVILNGTKIGDNCEIGENTVIGTDGFGYERMENGEIMKFIHFAGVNIGNNVNIGPLTSISKGVFTDTIIEDGVKIDALVHIAHNCKIGKGAFIIANTQLCGGVEILDNAWVSPHCTILNNVIVGKNSTIGLGSVVIKNVPDNSVAYGNPAKVK